MKLITTILFTTIATLSLAQVGVTVLHSTVDNQSRVGLSFPALSVTKNTEVRALLLTDGKAVTNLWDNRSFYNTSADKIYAGLALSNNFLTLNKLKFSVDVGYTMATDSLKKPTSGAWGVGLSVKF